MKSSTPRFHHSLGSRGFISKWPGTTFLLGTMILLGGCEMTPTPPPATGVTPPPVSLASGRKLTDEFAARLKQALGAALSEGGAVAGIEVCHAKAPQIAAEVSAEYGVELKRVSQRARNPQNQPTQAEAATLKAFSDVFASGSVTAPVETLDTAAELATEQQLQPRYMRAIPVQPLCLTCHGQPAADVQAALDQYYPDDMATGYHLGDLRGAFVVTWPE